MQNDQKTGKTGRIDLSNCKLLSPYGRNAADALKVGPKVGQSVKIGVISKFGLITKLSPVKSARLAGASIPAAVR
jgi:hypothetical protein